MKKKLILTLFIAFIYYSNAQEIKPNWIVIGNLEVALADLSLEFSQSEAWDELRKMDNSSTPDQHGWRLPTKDELNSMYINKNAIGGFSPNSYWSSTEMPPVFAWNQYFNYGGRINDQKTNKNYVRAVRPL